MTELLTHFVSVVQAVLYDVSMSPVHLSTKLGIQNLVGFARFSRLARIIMGKNGHMIV
jgi:hypothetical protein